SQGSACGRQPFAAAGVAHGFRLMSTTSSSGGEMLEPPRPVLTGDLLGGLHDELMALLRGLPPAAWQAPTSAGAWRVRDVVAHLLDTALRRLSSGRDGYTPPGPPLHGYDDVLQLLTELNAVWAKAGERVSHAGLRELME